MNKEIFSNISKIIERDSKATTYKFALLRGTIDLVQENSPFLEFKDGRVHFPIGLLIEKWMIYYYPIFDSKNKIPQIHGHAKLSLDKIGHFEGIVPTVVFFFPITKISWTIIS
jgi:hypothetical protein